MTLSHRILRLSKKIPIARCAVGGSVALAAAAAGLAACDTVPFNSDFLRFELNWPVIGAVAGASVGLGYASVTAFPRLISRTATPLLDRVMPYDEEQPRARRGCVMMASASALLACIPAALGWMYDAPAKSVVAPVLRPVLEKIEETKHAANFKIDMLYRYVLTPPGISAPHRSQSAQWRDFITDLPPDDVLDFPAFYRRKYVRGETMPLGACAHVWTLYTLHRGKPVYMGQNTNPSQQYLCYDGHVTEVSDAMSHAYFVHKPESSPFARLRNRMPAIEMGLMSKPHAFGEPGSSIGKKSGGYEFRFDDLVLFTTDDGDTTTARKYDSDWQISEDARFNRQMAPIWIKGENLPEGWWNATKVLDEQRLK